MAAIAIHGPRPFAAAKMPGDMQRNASRINQAIFLGFQIAPPQLAASFV
jgi:hypothetical protein